MRERRGQRKQKKKRTYKQTSNQLRKNFWALSKFVKKPISFMHYYLYEAFYSIQGVLDRYSSTLFT